MHKPNRVTNTGGNIFAGRDKNKHFSKGFTLIELLVVIAIIALLLSIMLPALNTAKSIARKTVCGTQMKQWSVATVAFVSESINDYFPYFGNVLEAGGFEDPDRLRPYWWESLSPYLDNMSKQFKDDMTAQELYEVSFGMDIRKCPAGRKTNDPVSFNSGPWSCWIGTNWCETNVGNAKAQAPFYWKKYIIYENKQLKYSKVKAPAQVLMYTDTRAGTAYSLKSFTFNTDTDGDGELDSCSRVSAGVYGKYNGIQADIHRGQCNIALMDGHVESIRKEDLLELEDGPDGKQPAHDYWYMNY